MNPLKILEICPYSAGGCGVWQRVKQESLELSKLGHEVLVFSSNIEKGTNKIISSNEEFEKIRIKRFPAKKLGGESFLFWNFEKQATEFKPDIIICHVYRHLHTLTSLSAIKKIRKNKKCKLILVTHAPFVEGNYTRSFFSKLIVRFYDFFVGPMTINKFDKVVAITKWELPYLKKIKLRKRNLVYIPNGIPEEFFERKVQQGKNILFLGRISPIKNLETIIRAVPKLKNPKIIFDLIGPFEEEYKKKLDYLIKQLKIEKQVNFLGPIYDLKKKIQMIDKYNFFVLSSRREAMPQALIEAMARGKIVFASKTQGGKEIIQDNENGFLFRIGDSDELANLINNLENKNLKNISENAISTSKNFQWKNLIRDLEKLFYYTSSS